MEDIKIETRLLPVLRRRVNLFLKKRTAREIKLEKLEIYSKAVIMFSLLLIPFFAMFFFGFGFWGVIALATISATGMIGVGFNVMHDGGHDAFSKNRKVNKLMAGSIYLLAGNPFVWKNKHNVEHHTETNVDGHDHDIDTNGLFRFSKHQPWKKGHRFQFLYALPLYSFMTIMWATWSDWMHMRRVFRKKNAVSQPEQKKQWNILLISKVTYFSFWIIVPALVWQNSWDVLLFFFTMHAITGLVVTVIFQLAHVVPKAQMYDIDHIKDQWLKHQLLTSCNFATKSRFLTWYLGGLNRQKEHHIFPTKRHTTYRKMENTVRTFCKEIDIEYTEYNTLLGACWAHLVLLYQLGRKPKTV